MDKFEGQGTYRWANGTVYVGSYKDGLPHGRNTITVHSKFLGKGKKTMASGQSYEGDFIKDKFEGQGTYRWPNGDFYVGGWKEGQQNGNLFLI